MSVERAGSRHRPRVRVGGSGMAAAACCWCGLVGMLLLLLPGAVAQQWYPVAYVREPHAGFASSVFRKHSQQKTNLTRDHTHNSGRSREGASESGNVTAAATTGNSRAQQAAGDGSSSGTRLTAAGGVSG